MMNPKDPRTPQERAYPHDEPGDDETRVLHTEDPTEAYGRPVTNPTLVYPQYDPRFDSAAPPPNPTQQLGEPLGHYPTAQYLTAQDPTAQDPTAQYPQAQYQQGQYPPAGYPGGGYQPPAAPPPGYGQPAEPEKTPRGPRWGLLALAALVLIVLGGIVGFLLSGSGDDPESTATGPTTSRTMPPAPTTTPPPATAPEGTLGLPLDELPGGLGDVIGQTGAVVGSITANDGSSITLSGIGGTLTTVLFTPETQIITLKGSSPEALEIGATVVATGSPVESGQMTAETVISASLPSFGNPGN